MQRRRQRTVAKKRREPESQSGSNEVNQLPLKQRAGLTDNRKRKKGDNCIPITRATRRNNPGGQAVFQTAELLEHILVHLPALQLFTFKMVCKRFEAVISDSPAIRRKHFLDVDHKPTSLWTLNVHELGQPDVKPYWRAMTPDEASTYLQGHVPGMPDYCHPREPLRLCPLLSVRDQATMPSSAERAWRSSGKYEVAKLLRDLPLQPKPAGWRDMYLTDPPCTSVHISIEWRVAEMSLASSAGSYRMCPRVVDPEGLALGKVADALLSMKNFAVQPRQWVIHDHARSRTVLVKGSPGWHLSRWEKEHDVGAVIIAERTSFYLDRVVVPHENEWVVVKEAT